MNYFQAARTGTGWSLAPRPRESEAVSPRS
jgi:hypothetical protein